MKKFLLVTITTYGDSEEDPEYLENNKRYPEIIPYVEDEEELFVINSETDEFLKATDFFHMEPVDSFYLDED